MSEPVLPECERLTMCRRCHYTPLHPELVELEKLCQTRQAEHGVRFHPICECWTGKAHEPGEGSISVAATFSWDRKFALTTDPQKAWWTSNQVMTHYLLDDEVALKRWLHMMIERKKPQ